jgi:hypothetical protein
VAGDIVLAGPSGVQLLWNGPANSSYFAVGSSVAVGWSTQGSPTPALVHIELSRDGGESWEMLAANEANDGSYDWLVSGAETTDALLRVISSDGSIEVTGAATSQIYVPVPWIDPQPGSGQLAAGASDAITVEILSAGLPTGSHQAWLLIIDPAQSLQLTLPVQLDVLSGMVAAPASPRFGFRENFPNPFNPSTQLQFVLEAAGHTRLRIFDARGSLVETLLDRPMPAGRHAMRWDGSDARGHGVASGVYRVLLESSGRRATRSIALVR